MAGDGGGGESAFDGLLLSTQESLSCPGLGFVVYPCGESDAGGNIGETLEELGMVSESVLVRHSTPPPMVEDEPEDNRDCTGLADYRQWSRRQDGDCDLSPPLDAFLSVLSRGPHSG